MKIIASATTSNIASGFDVLGIALDLFLEVEIKDDSDTFKIYGTSQQYCNEDNLIVKGIKKVFEQYDKNYWNKIKNNISIKLKSDIPIARGLGSSAACIATGLVFANEYLYEKQNVKRLSKNELVRLGTELEGHPDNISAAILGGMTASSIDKEKKLVYSQKILIDYDFLKKFDFYVLIPDFEVKTEMARKLLPSTVEFKDAVFNLSRLALLFTALINKDEDLFAISFDDRLHQRYRSKLIYKYDEVINYTKESGAIASFISGSGSSIVSIVKKSKIKDEDKCIIKDKYKSKSEVIDKYKDKDKNKSKDEVEFNDFEEKLREKLKNIEEKYNRIWQIKNVRINLEGVRVI
ncbi:MAG TPA: homoserine kinase [Exilispira sp.]|nr:homoserine kinase [Exilispira sp.]